MNWGAIAKLLLSLVVWLIKNKLDDGQQKQLGYDQAFKELEAYIDERKAIARKISEDVARLPDDAIDVSLRPYFRTDDEPVNPSGKRSTEGDTE